MDSNEVMRGYGLFGVFLEEGVKGLNHFNRELGNFLQKPFILERSNAWQCSKPKGYEKTSTQTNSANDPTFEKVMAGRNGMILKQGLRAYLKESDTPSLLENEFFIAFENLLLAQYYSEKYPNNEMIKSFVKNIPDEDLKYKCDWVYERDHVINTEELQYLKDLIRDRGLPYYCGEDHRAYDHPKHSEFWE